MLPAWPRTAAPREIWEDEEGGPRPPPGQPAPRNDVDWTPACAGERGEGSRE